MKRISILFSIFLLLSAKAQMVSDYKYVLIPDELANFKNSKSYGLDMILKNSLKAKKYEILTDAKTNWPNDALMNPCKILTAEMLDDKSMFRNKVILQFKDCNKNVILSEKGSSTIKEFEEGYQDALRQALVKLPVSNPSVQMDKMAEQKSEEQTQKPDQTDAKEISSPASAALKYSNGKIMLQKIKIDDTQFILVDGNSSVPFASFKLTAKKDVYRVKLSSGESTIGYLENGNIVIEMPKSNGEFANEIFVAVN